jgi:hypothetical protein
VPSGVDAIGVLDYGIVATAPSPATSGTSLVLQTGQGANFPSGTFDVLLWAADTIPTMGTAEISRASVSGDTINFSGTRGKYGTTAQSVAEGWQVSQVFTANFFSEIYTWVLSLLSFTAAGQLLVGTGSDTSELLSLGSVGQGLVVVSGSPNMPAWQSIVLQLVAGTGISLSPSTGEGAVTVTNAGVTSLVAGQGISLSASTGAVTVGLLGSESVNVVSAAGSTLILADPKTDIGNDITLSANCSVSLYTGGDLVRGTWCYGWFRQPSSGGTYNYTTTFTNVKWPQAAPPVTTTGEGAYDRYDFVYDGTHWNGQITGQAYG